MHNAAAQLSQYRPKVAICFLLKNLGGSTTLLHHEKKGLKPIRVNNDQEKKIPLDGAFLEKLTFIDFSISQHFNFCAKKLEK